MSRSSSDPPSCCSATSARLNINHALVLSVPIVFTIILLFFFFFYFFYLRGRRVDWSNNNDISRTELGLKKGVREMLPIIVYKESFFIRDTLMRYFLGVEVVQNKEGIYIGQRKYAQEVLQRFGMSDSNVVKNPIVPGCKLMRDEGGSRVDATQYKQMIGSLMYVTVTRPDLMFVVSLASRFMEKLTELHMQVVKRVLRYIRGTVDLGMCYKKGGEGGELFAFSDSDYAGDTDDRKSTSGYVFLMSSGAVSWSSKKQPVVSLSTIEAEFISAASCACQAVWMQRVLKCLGWSGSKCTVIYCDNCSTIKLSKNPVLHGRSKHIDVRYHFLRDLLNDEIVELKYCSSQDQIADVMTKPLKLEVFEKLRMLLGVCSVPLK